MIAVLVTCDSVMTQAADAASAERLPAPRPATSKFPCVFKPISQASVHAATVLASEGFIPIFLCDLCSYTMTGVGIHSLHSLSTHDRLGLFTLFLTEISSERR